MVNKDKKTTAVPFFDYSSLFREQESELVEIFKTIGRRGAFIKQDDLAQFEAELSRFVNVAFALGVGNATDGLYLALQAVGVGPGQEVIFSSHTMLATAAAIHACGATPVPVDCGTDHLISPAAVEASISDRTTAILPTHLNGRTCDMEALCALAKKHNLAIIEDAAQALGAKYRGRFAGTFGSAAAISFYPAKVLGCLGDGGAVITDDNAVYDVVYQLANFGTNRDGEVVRWGMNSRLDNLQAAILSFRLKHLQNSIARRRSIARHYRERLVSVEEITLPPGPDSDVDHFDVYQNYEIEAARREPLIRCLAENGIEARVQWGGRTVHQHSALRLNRSLPQTDRIAARMLLLPMNTSLSDDDIERVCDVILDFYHKARSRGTASA